MSVYERDTEAGQGNAAGPPTFRMVRRGYDRDEVDAYIPQLVARLEEAVGLYAEQLVENARRRADTIIEKAQQQAEQVRGDVEGEAQKALEQAREVADHIRAEVEQER